MLEKLSYLRAKLIEPLAVNVNPNTVSWFALAMALLAGWFFWLDSLVLAGFCILGNGFFDILDGEIAKKFKKTSKYGDFLDHTLDRLADVAIFLGIAFNPNVPTVLALITIIVILLVSYLGTQAQALTKKRLYAGIIGRSDRLVLLFLIAVISGFYNILEYGIILILILSTITFVQRYWTISRLLKKVFA